MECAQQAIGPAEKSFVAIFPSRPRFQTDVSQIQATVADLSKGDKLGCWIWQKETLSFWQCREQVDGFGVWVGLLVEHGMVAAGVLAQDNF
jgi:hypothetical protein